MRDILTAAWMAVLLRGSQPHFDARVFDMPWYDSQRFCFNIPGDGVIFLALQFEFTMMTTENINFVSLRSRSKSQKISIPLQDYVFWPHE